MRRIIQANIDRFKLLLATETDPMKQIMEARLLAEEEAKLIQVRKSDEEESLLVNLRFLAHLRQWFAPFHTSLIS